MFDSTNWQECFLLYWPQEDMFNWTWIELYEFRENYFGGRQIVWMFCRVWHTHTHIWNEAVLYYELVFERLLLQRRSLAVIFCRLFSHNAYCALWLVFTINWTIMINSDWNSLLQMKGLLVNIRESNGFVTWGKMPFWS